MAICLVSLAMPFPALLRRSPLAGVVVALAASTVSAVPALPPAGAASLFQTAELNPDNFVLVAAPIGDGTRAQLNIYEQINSRRPCFAVAEGRPARVEPLLATFDFTGICGRYLDANGYSVRIGGSDLAPAYRLSVVRVNDDNLLLAVPTRSGVGPEMVVARTLGPGTDYLRLVLEPGWQLMRRAYNGRNLGHVYFYRDTWPGAPADVAGSGGSTVGDAVPAPETTAPGASAPGPTGQSGPVPLDVQLGSDALLMGPGGQGL
ncbi:DUF3747 domain-containing protein [Cyanobium sp. CH-040]|uniref:DUF3747 domain-containing protein n=1 Tax=Cyanobium sp. CH-040 TaxID=2823708 RepID=UPI0020CE8CDF|nr:DUF3747 domain-containing protein [Cyanobium sp. CH-040]